MDKDDRILYRKAVCATAYRLKGLPYKFGAESKSYTDLPAEVDCSELVEFAFRFNGIYIPDGSYNQYNYTVSSFEARPGDLGFFMDGARGVYHVGLLYDDSTVIEARATDEAAKFETGKVILRPRIAWENYKNFTGWRSHPDLVL